MLQPERLYGVLASCPSCGARPALRLSGWLLEQVAREDPHRRAASYKCQRRSCGAIYDILAGAVRSGE